MEILPIENTVSRLTQTFLELKPEISNVVIEQLICEFHSQDVEPEIVETIIRKLTENLLKNENKHYPLKWIDINNYIDSIYLGESKPNMGLDGTSFTLTQNYPDKTVSTGLYKQFKTALNPYIRLQNYEVNVGTKKKVVLNQKNQTIDYVYFDMNGNSYRDIVINAYPQSIVIHDSPLDDIGRTFSIRWISKTSQRVFDTNRQTIKEIETYLEDAGWVITPRRLKGILAAVISIAVTYNLATIKNEIDNPGVYFDKNTEKIKLINYNVHEPTQNEVENALNLINQLADFFRGHEIKMGTILKWGLMSIFGYATKQAGGAWMPWLYLYGKAGSGKTTLALINLFVYGTPNEDNNIGGSSFDTVARVGNRVSQSTLPIIVNEPEGALNKPSVAGMVKSAIESTVARGKYSGRQYKNIPSFTEVMITANNELPDGDALRRRFMIILFTHSEKKSTGEKKRFEEQFHIKSPRHSPLNKLKGLSNYFIWEIKNNPEFLVEDWKETANILINRAYSDYGWECPSWLLQWYEAESLDDLDDEEIEEIRIFLLNQINQATKKIQVWDDETGRPKNQDNFDSSYKTTSDFDDRVFSVLNESLIPWMGVHRTRDNKFRVYCTTGILKELKKVTSSSYNIQSVAELLNWEYKVIKISGKSKRVMITDYDDFLSFIYPNLDNINNLQEGGTDEVVL